MSSPRAAPQEAGQNSHVGTSLAQFSSGHLQQPDLTAMGVEQHQTLPTHAGQLRAELHHDPNQQLRRKAEVPGNDWCSGEKPIAWAGSRQIGRARSRSARTKSRMRSANRASVARAGAACCSAGTERPHQRGTHGVPAPEPRATRADQSDVHCDSYRLLQRWRSASPCLSEWSIDDPWSMAAAGSPQPNRPKASRPAATPPLQVMKINRREEQERLEREAAEARAAAEAAAEKARLLEERAGLAAPPRSPQATPTSGDEERFDMGDMEGMTMADLMGAPDQAPRREDPSKPRSVDDFDFDEEAFLAALDENAPVGTTGEVIQGTVIGLESDGIYVDIGGKAPGFMPKSEAGLGVVTNLRERFPKGLQVEVLVPGSRTPTAWSPSVAAPWSYAKAGTR